MVTGALALETSVVVVVVDDVVVVVDEDVVDDEVVDAELLEELDDEDDDAAVDVVGASVVVVVSSVVVVLAGSTTTVPCMEEWILQWYAQVPALRNVTEKGSLGFRQLSSCEWAASQLGLVSNDPSSAVAVCATESLLVHVTVSPSLTVTLTGLKAKFWMVTFAGAASASRGKSASATTAARTIGARRTAKIQADTITTLALAPRPTVCANPVRAPATWRVPAAPRSWSTSSTT